MFLTLIEAGILVLIVIVVFLQDWRAMLVPATTIPVTIIGAFAAMAALGFTINTTTMFGIVLAIGIVVDDAIVIVEGVAHHIERGMTPHDAAIKAMDELFGPVIGITLVLMSVFLPAAFVPGLTGKMFAQFALVIAATAFISAVNAATLKPTQCAMWLRPATPPETAQLLLPRLQHRLPARWRTAMPASSAAWCGTAGLMVLLALVLAGLGGWGVARLPTAFIPNEDQGYMLIGVQLPDGASLERTGAALGPGQRHRQGDAGGGVCRGHRRPVGARQQLGAGQCRRRLRDPEGLGRARRASRARTCARSSCISREHAGPAGRPGLPAGAAGDPGHRQCRRLPDAGRAARRQLRLRQAAERHAKRDRAGQHADRRSTNLVTSFRAGAPHVRVEVDRSKAETLKVSIGDVFTTLSSYLGSSYVNRFNKFGLTLQVFLQADSQYRTKPERHPEAAGAQRRRPDGADRRPGDPAPGVRDRR